MRRRGVERRSTNRTGRRGPSCGVLHVSVGINVNPLRPNKHLAVSQTFFSRNCTFVTRGPRAVTAQASAATVVTRLAGAIAVAVAGRHAPTLTAVQLRERTASQMWYVMR